MEEAFGKIEPRDEAQREKLDRMREKIQETNAAMFQEIERFREQQQRVLSESRSSTDTMLDVAQEREDLAREMAEGMVAMFEEQSNYLDRIAAKLRRR